MNDYPFRDYASVWKQPLDATRDELRILRRQYEAKCVELARCQRSLELLQEQLNVVRGKDEGAGKPCGG